MTTPTEEARRKGYAAGKAGIGYWNPYDYDDERHRQYTLGYAEGRGTNMRLEGAATSGPPIPLTGARTTRVSGMIDVITTVKAKDHMPPHDRSTDGGYAT